MLVGKTAELQGAQVTWARGDTCFSPAGRSVGVLHNIQRKGRKNYGRTLHVSFKCKHARCKPSTPFQHCRAAPRLLCRAGRVPQALPCSDDPIWTTLGALGGVQHTLDAVLRHLKVSGVAGPLLARGLARQQPCSSGRGSGSSSLRSSGNVAVAGPAVAQQQRNGGSTAAVRAAAGLGLARLS